MSYITNVSLITNVSIITNVASTSADVQLEMEQRMKRQISVYISGFPTAIERKKTKVSQKIILTHSQIVSQKIIITNLTD